MKIPKIFKNKKKPISKKIEIKQESLSVDEAYLDAQVEKSEIIRIKGLFYSSLVLFVVFGTLLIFFQEKFETVYKNKINTFELVLMAFALLAYYFLLRVFVSFLMKKKMVLVDTSFGSYFRRKLCDHCDV